MAAEAVSTLSIRLNIPLPEDVTNQANRIRVAVYVRMLNLWVLVPLPAVWFGGAPPTPHEIPVVGPMTAPDALGQSWPLWDMRGNPVRVEIEVQRAMRVGVSVTSRVPAGEPEP